MVFSSSLFLFLFLPLFLGVYFLTPTRFKNGVILAFSVFFYTWGAPKFVFVILGSIIIDYILSKKIYYSIVGKQRKRWLVFSILLNVSVLLYFKYSNFFIENFNTLLADFGFTQVQWTHIALPIGISFFTFHELSYIIDVYRGVNKPMKRLIDYAVYILLFPQLIAGPIIRYKEIAHQIIDRKNQETIDNKLTGILRFIIGLAKKVLIANTLGIEVDRIFALPHQDLSTSIAWIGIIAYSLQIYFDFSGYSDMAIGIARMIGFYFPENFNNPYIAQNITEFWRRWHMSLSRWMRDYLYIPLGGNKVKTKTRLYVNLWLVFLISGFWHGASWNFIVWGGFHGFFLICDRLFLVRFTEKIGKIPSMFITYLIVLIGWVFFRSENLSSAFDFIRVLFSFHFLPLPFPLSDKFLFFFIFGLIVSLMGSVKIIEALQNQFYEGKIKPSAQIAFSLLCIILLFICAGSITSSGFNPFIYFRF
ncbi:MAG: MBOAT family protein [Bacteroidota bacterium]